MVSSPYTTSKAPAPKAPKAAIQLGPPIAALSWAPPQRNASRSRNRAQSPKARAKAPRAQLARSVSRSRARLTFTFQSSAVAECVTDIVRQCRLYLQTKCAQYVDNNQYTADFEFRLPGRTAQLILSVPMAPTEKNFDLLTLVEEENPWTPLKLILSFSTYTRDFSIAEWRRDPEPTGSERGEWRLVLLVQPESRIRSPAERQEKNRKSRQEDRERLLKECWGFLRCKAANEKLTVAEYEQDVLLRGEMCILDPQLNKVHEAQDVLLILQAARMGSFERASE